MQAEGRRHVNTIHAQSHAAREAEIGLLFGQVIQLIRRCSLLAYIWKLAFSNGQQMLGKEQESHELTKDYTRILPISPVTCKLLLKALLCIIVESCLPV